MITSEVCTLVWAGYSEDGALYRVTLDCADGSRLVLDYDAYLADQSHHGVILPPDLSIPSIGAFEPHDWHGWLSGTAIPKRMHTADSTACRTFNTHYRELRDFCALNSATSGRLSVTKHRRLYRFVEHMLKKQRAGELLRSHSERLALLPFVWGSESIPAMTLFGGKAE